LNLLTLSNYWFEKAFKMAQKKEQKLSNIFSFAAGAVIAASCYLGAQILKENTDMIGRSEPVSNTIKNQDGKPASLEAFDDFCNRHPSECKPNTSEEEIYKIDKTTLYLLESINMHVNANTKYMTDIEQYNALEYYNLTESGYGDCEDYVLAKRKLAISMGIPDKALSLGVVYTKNGDGHAVLVVNTDLGSLVLDNSHDIILPWHQTNYFFAYTSDSEDITKLNRVTNNRFSMPKAPKTPAP
jgi:predicted transglutaminase-like cysteine proteinase